MRQYVILFAVGSAGWAVSFYSTNAWLCVALALPSGFAIGTALRAACRCLSEDD